MKKCLVLSNDKRQQALADLSLPVIQDYAARHGYDVFVSHIATDERGGWWRKVPALREALNRSYDVVLWLDSDILVLDPTHDIADAMRPEDFQAFVLQTDRNGFGPNTGVWLLRNKPEAQEFLQAVWEHGQLKDSPWHVQAAVCRLLGWSTPPAEVKPVAPSTYLLHTGWLPERWNVNWAMDRLSAVRDPAFLHFCGGRPQLKEELMLNFILRRRLPGYDRVAHLEGVVPAPFHAQYQPRG
jgi:hypothetical protein